MSLGNFFNRLANVLIKFLVTGIFIDLHEHFSSIFIRFKFEDLIYGSTAPLGITAILQSMILPDLALRQKLQF